MEKKFQRDEHNKIIGGVATGLAEYLDVDKVWIRLGFVLMAVLGFSGVLIYLILWIVVPARPFFEFQQEPFPKQVPRRSNTRPRTLVGFTLIILGLYFTLNTFYFIPLWEYIKRLWPAVLIIIGIYMVLGASRGRTRKSVENRISDSEPDKTGGENI